MSPSSTSWADQILSNRVRGISAPPQPGGDDGQETRRPRSVVSEVMREVGVERDAVAGAERVALAVDGEGHLAVEDDRRLAASRFMERRIPGGPGARPPPQ